MGPPVAPDREEGVVTGVMGVGLGGPKWMARGTPNQDILLHLVPWDKTCFVPSHSLSEQAVILMHTPTG